MKIIPEPFLFIFLQANTQSEKPSSQTFRFI